MVFLALLELWTIWKPNINNLIHQKESEFSYPSQGSADLLDGWLSVKSLTFKHQLLTVSPPSSGQ